MTLPELPELKLLNTSVCPRCGAGLRCGNVAGDTTCWCAQLPHVMPLSSSLPRWGRAGAGASPEEDTIKSPHPNPPPAGTGADPAATCLCPACLKQIIDERLNA